MFLRLADLKHHSKNRKAILPVANVLSYVILSYNSTGAVHVRGFFCTLCSLVAKCLYLFCYK